MQRTGARPSIGKRQPFSRAGQHFRIVESHSSPHKRSAECQAQPDEKTVAIVGATGLVGSRLTKALTAKGYTVKALTRNEDKARNVLPASTTQIVGSNKWEEAIPGCYGIVNLAGEPISTRWNAHIKQEIMDSRVNTTQRLTNAINGVDGEQRPRVFVSASAVGAYGISRTSTFDETSTGRESNDYLSLVCERWEAAAQKADCRVVIIRNGIVLSPAGGALQKMIPVFKLFGGGPLASGEQWCSWVHIDDLVNMYIQALQPDSAMKGVYNGTAPQPVRMKELCSSLGRAMHRPSWLPVPEFALKALLGEGAMVVAEGQKVLPKETQNSGFQFAFSDVDSALTDLL